MERRSSIVDLDEKAYFERRIAKSSFIPPTDLPRLASSGILAGQSVWIRKKSEALYLYNHGFFGKGTLSRSKPMFGAESSKRQHLHYRRALKRDAERAKLHPTAEEVPVMKKEKPKLAPPDKIELLQLSGEEAFFLRAELAKLDVYETEESAPMSVQDLWTYFCSHIDNFPCNYAVYLYFRGRGWTPRSGVKFASEFVIYRSGPGYHHSEHVVQVIPAWRDTGEVDTVAGTPLTWRALQGLNRTASQVLKGVVLAYVLRPRDVDTTTPACVSLFQIVEVIYRRFVPSRERSTLEAERTGHVSRAAKRMTRKEAPKGKRRKKSSKKKKK